MTRGRPATLPLREPAQDVLLAIAELLAMPAHPYTRALRSAVPEVGASTRSARIVLHGEPPDATSPPPGCVFHPRCPLAIDRCRAEVPVLAEVLAGIEMPAHPAPAS